MKNRVVRRLCASGCRATPEIKALPAMPSPMAAPTAPPARASPPPTSAPAVLMALSRFAASVAMILLEGRVRVCRVSVGRVRGSVRFKRRRGAEVEDGQEREDKRLDAADE